MNWEIDKEKLIDYKAPGWTEDYFVTSPNKNYGIVVYNIDEWRMGYYAGLIGIYSDSKNPKLVLNSSRTQIWFDNEKTFSFLEKSDCIVCRKPAYNPNIPKGDFPFLLIKIKERKFAFFEFDNTSIYYGLEEIGKDKSKLIEVHPRDLECNDNGTRKGEILDLGSLQWFDIIDFDRALTKYES